LVPAAVSQASKSDNLIPSKPQRRPECDPVLIYVRRFHEFY
jgi:hypothetical protein